ncbi:hypothetical protein L7F22_001682 [Adiantum nelumboides]|nr:hypothetical protein [Adiantum nelumboides]
MVKTRSVSASCSSPHRQQCPSAALAPRKHKRRKRTLVMANKKKKLRRQRALHKQTDGRGNGGSASNLGPDSQKNSLPQTAFKTVHKRGVKSKSPSNAVALTEEDSSERKPNSSARNHLASNSGNLGGTNVRIVESAEACTKERSCSQLTEVDHDCILTGWTSEQDAALQTAYFQVRPSSNFWFEVSKKISGKTAKDCFDRFYSAHPTPPNTQARSKKISTESPVRTISFLSPTSTLKCKGRFGRGKQGLLKAHQTVRHILRHQKVADESYEADVFSAVERLNHRDSLSQNCVSRVNSPLPSLKRNNSKSGATTPATCSGYARSDNEVWWSVSSKLRTRSGYVQNEQSSGSARQIPLMSPEVLKAERNPSRLDRFLDILHMRRVPKRKSSTLRGIAQSREHLNAESRSTQCFAAAKEAILMDAKEALRTTLKQKSGEEASFSSDEIEDESSLASE